MFRNYIKTALRTLWKNKTTSFINVTGLAIGLSCCLFMVLYIQHELSYDKFHQKGDRIVRVIMEYSFNGSPVTKGNFTSTRVLPTFKQSFPEIEEGVRIHKRDRLVKYEDKLFIEKKFFHADSTFFQIFSFKLLRGDAAQVLRSPKMVVVSESTARKYFGDQDPIGKILGVGSGNDTYTVTGIVEDFPSNSQLKFDFIASLSSYGAGPLQETNYFNANYTTYFLLKNKNSNASLQEKIGPFMKKELSDQQGTYANFELEPYTRVHLYSPYAGFEFNSSITYIYIIAGIALLVLAIACFTYINLSTARSLERAKEVGIRKVSGAVRWQIFWQFISESFLLTTMALVVSFVLVAVLLPSFNMLANKSLQFAGILQPSVVAAVLLITIAIALLAGSYPALILSKFQPVRVLKGAFKHSSSGTLLRRSLIVFQFVISVFLIAATIVIRGQMSFIQNKKMGYDRDHVIVLNVDQRVSDKIELFKTELKTNSEVLAVSKANNTPVDIQVGYGIKEMSTGQAINIRGNNVDEEYIRASGLEIVTGSDFSRQDMIDAHHGPDSTRQYKFIINETAAKAFGWSPHEAVGQKMLLGNNRPGEVKAVVKDFHFASLHTAIEPLVLFPGDWGSTVMVKLRGNNLAATVGFLETKWKQLAPHRPFAYKFMDEEFNQLYNEERRTARVFNIFSIIAISLACLGLFGLSAYSPRQRIKEIGVRKVLGASAGSIALLLSNSFIRLVIIAFVIACPLVWLVMNKWLEDFAYRIHISWWMFGLAGVLAVLIALITVSFQAIRAAVANPVKALRTE